MKTLAELVDTYKVEKPQHKGTSEQADAIHAFYERLVTDYKAFKGKQYNDEEFKKILALKINSAGYRSVGQKRILYGVCSQSKNFGKAFWWRLKQ